MFIRRKKNRNGSFSITIIDKSRGHYKVIKSFGSAVTADKIAELHSQASLYLQQLQKQQNLFSSTIDVWLRAFLKTIKNSELGVIGPELVFGRLYDHVGFNKIDEPLFRHLVISRLVFPLSKLKTIDYLYRYQGINLKPTTVYRFLDKLNSQLKEQIQQIAYEQTLRTLKGTISIVFYDMTTLYFEASDEDDLRKTGFSKEGKHQNPQIYLGLLVALGGYAIGYDIFEGNISEGRTLLPTIEKLTQRFGLSQPVIVADAGLLSNDNVQLLEQKGYRYILGARIKNESHAITKQILSYHLNDDQYSIIQKDNCSLIIHYSDKRAAKDAHNRKRGLFRLEKQLKSGKLTKANINNKGYNKYLKIEGNVQITIDYDKYKSDARWDGLKGYISNTKLPARQIIDSYKNLWEIEKAFRMSKTDLRIRPVYHRLKNRIEAHICIAFSAYCLYKELERILKKQKAPFSVKRAVEITQNMYQLSVIMPESKTRETILLQVDQEQKLLLEIIQKNT